MKLKNLFYLLLALPLAFASCSDILGDEKEPAKTPKLTVTSSLTVEFEADGGSGIITYTLENAPEGAQVSATCEADWVSDLTVGAMITYKVSKNDGDARDTKIVVSYEQQVVEVSLTQAAKPASTAPKFTLTSANVIEVTYEQAAKSIEFTLENPIEGVEVEAKASADWISITNIAENAIDFIIAENEGSARTATITATYGLLEPIVVTVNQAQYVDPNAVIIPFEVTECWASSENGGKQWDVTFVEHDALLGDMYTRISFALAKANTQRVTDGTYSVANGNILLNANNENGNSTYRYNSSEVADILDATFTVATDTTAKTISIEGTFKSGDKNFEIKYNGEMSGMDLSEAIVGAIEYNEWSRVYHQWSDTKEFLFYAISADEALNLMLDVYHTGGAKKFLPAGTYPVEASGTDKTEYVISNSKATYNGVVATLASGSITVEYADGSYKLIFDITDILDRRFTGTYEGAIEGVVIPE